MNAPSPPRIDWSRVEQARLRARRDRAEAVHRLLVHPLRSLACRLLRAQPRIAPAFAR